MKKYEYCCQCGEATGRAGEDSMYTEHAGPFCEDCYPEATPPAAQPALAMERVRRTRPALPSPKQQERQHERHTNDGP